MKLYALRKTDGSVSIMQVIEQQRIIREETSALNEETGEQETLVTETVEKFYQDPQVLIQNWIRVAADGTIENTNDRDAVVSIHEITADKIPTDRTFRNAWKHGDDGLVTVHMPTARNMHMDKIREERNKKLQHLDVEQLKGNDVAAEKKIMRNIPQTFDLTGATTPEELSALWPDELK